MKDYLIRVTDEEYLFNDIYRDLEFDGLNWVQLYSDTNRINTSFDFIEYNFN